MVDVGGIAVEERGGGGHARRMTSVKYITSRVGGEGSRHGKNRFPTGVPSEFDPLQTLDRSHTLPHMKVWPRRRRISERRLIQAAETIARTLDLGEDKQVEALRADGFDEGEAHRLVTLLPIAFSRPVLEELGVQTFVRKVTAVDANGNDVTADLMRQPEYVAGLRLARRHRRVGLMDHAAYKLVAGSSAAINAASNALNEGADIRGAAIATSLIGPEIARHLIR
jgi:hypothetical protein